MEEQQIKRDEIRSGENIRRIRKARGVGQTELALEGVDTTREALGKIKRGKQYISASQLRAIRDILSATYEERLKKTP